MLNRIALTCLTIGWLGFGNNAPGNFVLRSDYLVSAGNQIRGYDSSGQVVGSVTVQPAAPGSIASGPRGFRPLSDGDLAVYSGTFEAGLSLYDIQTSSWTTYTVPGLSTANNISYGGLDVLGNSIFLSDMSTGSAGAAQGIVRFDRTSEQFTRFGEDYSFRTLSIGRDRLLYGVEGNEIVVFDPITLSEESVIRTPFTHDLRGLAVQSDGRIFGIDWAEMLYEYDRNGAVVNSLDVRPFMSSFGDTMDLDIRFNGDLLFGSRSGDYYLSDSEFSSVDEFSTGTTSEVRVAFGIPEPGTATACVALAGVAALRRRRR